MAFRVAVFPILLLATHLLVHDSFAAEDITCYTCGSPEWLPEVTNPTPCNGQSLGDPAPYFHEDGGLCIEVTDYTPSLPAIKNGLVPPQIGQGGSAPQRATKEGEVVFRGYLTKAQLEGIGLGDKQCGIYTPWRWTVDNVITQQGLSDAKVCGCASDNCNGYTSTFKDVPTRCYECFYGASGAGKSTNSLPFVKGAEPKFADCAKPAAGTAGDIRTRTADSTCNYIRLDQSFEGVSGGQVVIRGSTPQGWKRDEGCSKVSDLPQEWIDMLEIYEEAQSITTLCTCDGDLCNNGDPNGVRVHHPSVGLMGMVAAALVAVSQFALKYAL